ncbi:MAG: hypothetical protein AAF928_19130 [Myxococcota bacterium]
MEQEKGPLDSLLAGLRNPAPHLPDVPVHPRVLTVPEPGGVSLLFVVWRDPGGARALHEALRTPIEAALLSELSRPAESAFEVPLRSLRVVSFASVPQMAAAVAAFGLTPAALDDTWRDDIARARGEASVVGRDVPDEAAAVFRAPAHTSPVALELEPKLRERCGEEVWGTRPGAFFARAADLLGHAETWGPDLDAVDAFAALVIPDTTGALRWIPPLCFQALCDAVAIAAAESLGAKVAWAEATPDEDGLTPPPVVALEGRGGKRTYLQVGEELLRWCIMPVHPGETIPPLSAWVRDRFVG